jgi:acetyl-CoA C-acetyltransferase
VIILYIKSFHSTVFEKTNKPSYRLAYDTALETLKNADMKINQLDAIIISNINLLVPSETTRHISSIMSSMLKTRIPIIHTPAACAGGGVAFHVANKINYDNILVIGTEKMSSATSAQITESILTGSEPEHEYKQGLNFPAQNALLAQQHMLKYNTTIEDLDLISKKNHDNGSLNPASRFFKRNITLDQIKSSPIVASPLKLFHCTFPIDGAASILLTKDKTDLKVSASQMATDAIALFERPSLTNLKATQLAANKAYSQAKISPNDIDIVEIHDAFSILEIVSYEDLGFCPQGNGKELIRNQITNLDGKLPVNPSGGLKAKGHPLSATGVSQIVELCLQLRNEAGDSQVTCKRALAQNIGGAGGTVTVNIIEKN